MKYWQVDSFTNKPFKGNPAAVVIIEEQISDELMQNLANEFNLSETAFILIGGDKTMLRWFTPMSEIDLCGHATLAAAHIYFTELNPSLQEVIFQTKWVGDLKVTRGNGSYSMEFPSRAGDKVDVSSIPESVLKALSQDKPIDAYLSRDLMLVYENERTIREMQPNFEELRNYDKWIIVTSKSVEYDFISRFFCVDDGIL